MIMNTSKERPMIIGISGKAGCGKTTLAELLVAAIGENWQRMALGDAVKREAAEVFGFLLALAYSGEGKDTIVPVSHVVSGVETMTVRQILQYWGTDVRRAQDQGYWVKDLAAAIPDGKNVIVDDIRFASEVYFIHSLGGLVIRINPYHGYQPPELGGDHVSETELDDFQDFDLTYSPPLGGLPRLAEKIATRLDLHCITSLET